MSKKTEDDDIDLIYEEISKEYGDGIISQAKTFAQESQQVISVSPALDLALNGGIPEGSWVTLSGRPKIGKTSLAMHFCRKCQLSENGARDIYYFDIEGRLKKMNLLPGINPEKFFIIRSQQGKILNAEEFLTIAEKIACTKPKCVIVLDSVSALCTETEFNNDMSAMQRADGPKLLAKFCRKMAGRIPVNNLIVIAITHIMANPTGYGNPTQEKSGFAVQFQVDVKLKAKTMKLWEIPSQSKPIGQSVTWVMETSALGGIPFTEVESHIRYGQGIDELYELINLSVDLGLIAKGGAWYTCGFLSGLIDDYDEKKFKFQGQEKLYEFFKNNDQYAKLLDKTFKDIIKS